MGRLLEAFVGSERDQDPLVAVDVSAAQRQSNARSLPGENRARSIVSALSA